MRFEELSVIGRLEPKTSRIHRDGGTEIKSSIIKTGTDYRLLIEVYNNYSVTTDYRYSVFKDTHFHTPIQRAGLLGHFIG